MSTTNDSRAHRRHDAGDLHETVSAIAELVRREVRREIGQVREKAGEVVEKGRRKAREAREGMAERIRERPLTSLAIAGSVGLLIGLLARRRR
jgi:ElaB/YqjD/DUF883 family membrane-anchored ribosome-binding protein